MLAAVCIAICVALLLAHFTNAVTRFRFRRFPGPTPALVVGNMGVLKDKPLFTAYMDVARDFGSLYTFWIGMKPVLVCSGSADPELAHQICQKKFKAFHDRPAFLVPGFGKRRLAEEANIATAKGDLWAALWAGCQTVFHSARLSTYGPLINSATDAMLAAIIKHEAQGDAFCFSDLAGQLSMRVVFRCIFGVDVPLQGLTIEGWAAQTDGEHEVITALRTLFAVSRPGTFWAILSLASPTCLRPYVQDLAYLCGDAARIDGARDVLYAAAQQLLTAYCASQDLAPFPEDRELLGKGASMRPLPEGLVPSDASLLAALVHARGKDGKPLEPYQVLQQGNVFMAAGFETTAVTLAFTVFLLATNPEAEAKLLKEIDRVGRDFMPTYKNAGDWPYALAALHESMRLYPVNPVVARIATEDTELAGRAVPKDTSVHINVIGMHHNSAFFLNPEAFQPERFVGAFNPAPGDTALQALKLDCAAHPAYMPFGAGARSCPGMRIAMMDMSIALVRLYQRFLFRADESCPAVKLKMGFSLSPDGGIWMKAVAR